MYKNPITIISGLAHNRLQTIEHGALVDVSAMIWLDNNQLQTLPNLGTTLTEIYLNNNLFFCHQNLCWIKEAQGELYDQGSGLLSMAKCPLENHVLAM